MSPKMYGKQWCKPCNVHPNGSDGKLICDQNKKTRQMKPDDLKQKKGSTYFSSVQVSGRLMCGYSSLIQARLNILTYSNQFV